MLQQVDAPQRLYERPANLFVAEFIGSPAMNLVDATLERGPDGLSAVFGRHRLGISPKLAESRAALAAWEGRQLIVGFRPEDLEDAALVHERDAGAELSIVVDIREDVGSEVYIHFDLGVPAVRRAEVVEAKDRDTVAVPGASPFVARLARATTAREREPLSISMNAERLYFFDPETGDGIYGSR